ncbi:MAG: SMI1/KNR4 family protein [Alphaproteobacteria bacterium]|nr:SMI1/KNR4 family protein [Alphaproteobacteria bacterium]
MEIELVRELALHPAPGFVCTPAGGRRDENFTARVAHLLGSPASAASIRWIGEKFGEMAAPFVQLYTKHDGFVLYRDMFSDAAGICVLPVREWKNAEESLAVQLSDLGETGDPNCIKSGIAFAEVPHSSDYFIVPVEGPSRGKVFYANHDGDGLYGDAFANSLDEFIIRVCGDPIVLLNDVLGCYTRYSDGATELQWIPERYLPDIRSVS